MDQTSTVSAMRNHTSPAPWCVGALYLPLAVFFFIVAPWMYGQELGKIVYIEGDVQLVRDGEVRNGYQLSIGEPVEEMDVIQTGFDGFVEIELLRPQRSTVRIRENTVYYVEMVEGENGSTTTRLKLLTGSLEIAVDHIAPADRVQVETRTAVVGVRGTVFDVLTTPDESTLLGVREGRVAIAAGNSDTVVYEGQVVESTTDGPLIIETVTDGNYKRYYDRWTEIRLQMFRSGASTFVRAYARRYLDSIDSFRDTYDDLVAYRSALENAAGGNRSLGDDMLLRGEVSPTLIAMRSILPIFENTVYRLRELRRFHDQGIGTTTIDGQSSARFFQRFAQSEDELIARLAEVRTIFRLYRAVEERSFGVLPGGMGTPFNGSGNDFLDSRGF